LVPISPGTIAPAGTASVIEYIYHHRCEVGKTRGLCTSHHLYATQEDALINVESAL
jgi:hypothetical protein